MQTSNHIIRASLVALALVCQPAAHSQPATRQAAPAMPPEAYAATRYNRTDEIKLQGQIEHVETVDGKLFVWVVAKSVEQDGFGVRPGTEVNGKGNLWRVDGAAEKVKDADKAKLVRGAQIEVAGHNATDVSCKPTCRINSKKISFD